MLHTCWCISLWDEWFWWKEFWIQKFIWKRVWKICLENKKEKLFSLTGGAHPSGPPPSSNRPAPESLSVGNRRSRSPRAHVLRPPGSRLQVEGVRTLESSSPHFSPSSLLLPSVKAQRKPPPEVLRRPRVGRRSEPFSLRFGAVVSFLSSPASSPSIFLAKRRTPQCCPRSSGELHGRRPWRVPRRTFHSRAKCSSEFALPPSSSLCARFGQSWPGVRVPRAPTGTFMAPPWTFSETAFLTAFLEWNGLASLSSFSQFNRNRKPCTVAPPPLNSGELGPAVNGGHRVSGRSCLSAVPFLSLSFFLFFFYLSFNPARSILIQRPEIPITPSYDILLKSPPKFLYLHRSPRPEEFTGFISFI